MISARSSASRNGIRMFKANVGLIATLVLVLASAGSAAAAPYEPNDNQLQAVGPMTGGKNYDTTLETANDEDWFYFYTVGQAQVSLKVTTIASPQDKDCGYISILLLDAAGQSVKYIDSKWGVGQFDEYVWTVPGAQKYHVQVLNDEGTDGIGCGFRLTLNPAAAFTTTPPPDDLTISTCKTSQANVGTYASRLDRANQALASNQRKLTGAKRKLRRTHNRYTRRSLRRKIRSYRRRIRQNQTQINQYQALLNGANSQVSQSCTPQVLELIRNTPAS